ncbi:hypothetical protein BDV59DRAFT_204317 [Aspergillus ambiguus]|uniref:uncharacterized protein n=1 Tax=Aspergillus ambiguus TaxID=176160 RepID=UPI003CCD9CDC
MLQPGTSTAKHGGSAREDLAVQQPVDRPQRFYRSVDNVSRGDSPIRTQPGSAAGTGTSGQSGPPDEQHQLIELEETRLGAQQTLELCRNVITVLELTRLRKSRTGQVYWLGFWDRLYERPLARMLATRLTAALVKVDTLFRTVARELHHLTERAELAVRHAASEKDVLRILEAMEHDVGVWRRRRRKKAQAIVNRMRASIEAIPIVVSDALFDDLKRGVFALDVFCDYHPGDADVEEREAAWSGCFAERPGNLVAVSPYLYRQWEQSAASGTYVPLAAYAGNHCYDDWTYAADTNGLATQPPNLMNQH